MNKLLLTLLLICGFACGNVADTPDESDVEIGETSQALTNSLSGTIKYLNHWDPLYSGSATYFRFKNYPNNRFTLANVKFCLHQNPPGVELCTFTDVSGAYSLSGIPTGTYTPRIYWENSNGKFKMTDDLGTTELFSDNTTLVSVSPSFTQYDINFGLNWNDANSVAAASTYAAVLAWFDALGSALNLNSDSFFTNMGQIQIRNSTVTSGSSAYAKTQVFAVQTNMIVWHELGHTLEENMHTQKWGSQGVWKNVTPYYGTIMANCLTPTGSTQRSSNDATKEGWADFVMDLVEFANPGTAGAGTNVCAGLGFCGVANVGTANPLTMPACGAGSSGRSRNVVAAAFVDLIDTSDVNPLGNCLHDTVNLTMVQIVKAMRDTNWTSTAQSWGNSQIDVDEVSLPSVLYTVQQETGVHMYNIWADSCFQPGRAFGALLP